jgi:secreted trypsin-like serine protease
MSRRATLIHEDILLTAAHCYKAFVSYGVYIGGTQIDGSESEFVLVESEYPHVNYTPGYEYNDIMLVKLSNPSISPTVVVDYSEIIESDDIKNSSAIQTNQTVVTVIGYGYTSTGSDATYSENLLKTEIDVLSINKCIEYYGPDISENTMICATGDISTLNTTTNATADACLGDSGGPMLLPLYETIVMNSSSGTSRSNNSTNSTRAVTVTKLVYKQIGIVSFGDGCGVVRASKCPIAYFCYGYLVALIEKSRLDVAYKFR